MIKGLDILAKQMDELQKAIEALDGEIGSVNFDPHDPQSIDVAIQKMEAEVDERIASYSNNEMVQGVANEMKERFREAILERANEARTEEDPEA